MYTVWIKLDLIIVEKNRQGCETLNEIKFCINIFAGAVGHELNTSIVKIGLVERVKKGFDWENPYGFKYMMTMFTFWVVHTYFIS